LTFWKTKVPQLPVEMAPDPLMESMRATSLWSELKAARKRDLLTSIEMEQVAVKICELSAGHVKNLHDEGFISIEVAKPYVIKVLEDDPRKVFDFFDAGMVTREEAHIYALRACQIGND